MYAPHSSQAGAYSSSVAIVTALNMRIPSSVSPASTHSSLRILCKLCYMHPPTQACAYSASCVHCIHPLKRLRILCKLCTCIHPLKPCAYSASCVHASTSLKPAHTLQAVYMHPPTQASAYSASCVHASTHSSLRILCKLCTCIHPLKPPHTLQAVYIQTPHASLHASLHASSACKVCMYRQRHACACRACMQRVLHVESACRTCRFACIIFMQNLQICMRIYACEE